MSQHIEWLTIADNGFTPTPGEWSEGESRNNGPALWFGDGSGNGAVIEAPSKAVLIHQLECLLAVIKVEPEAPEPAVCKHCGVPVHLVPETMGARHHVWLHQGQSQWFEECRTEDLAPVPGGLTAAPLLTGG